MKSVYLVLLGLLSSGLWAQSLTLTQPVRLLALGDSYTIGESVAEEARWPHQLADSLKAAGVTVEYRRIIAKTGWRTDQLRDAVAGQGLDEAGYNLVGLLIGVNNQYQGRSVDTYAQEFRQLLDSALAYVGGRKERVFVVSIPDYAYTPFGQTRNPSKISAELDGFNAVNRQIAAEYGVTRFDITPLSREGLQRPELVAADGLHPSGVQYQEWVHLMMETFRSVISSSPVREPRGFLLYPNPFHKTLYWQSDRVLPGGTLSLYAADGQPVWQHPLQPVLSVQSLPAGVYAGLVRNHRQELIYRTTLVVR
ncbi:Lysophospholipase L1 [Catalinimonas alkaloidigena]|uniref:Lysophospholipase L1 n=1 Tax=Catalinimonas alkaloidigena TaxID=1075417 RepID=A0A1G9SC54_9BACT|nr:GDSL-type esterase/lipase family protein [Catalinimonas alkaloidigena]SDM33076.1 Lysophospholipase L1 [Catalinimonas alkaloidigena]